MAERQTRQFLRTAMVIGCAILSCSTQHESDDKTHSQSQAVYNADPNHPWNRLFLAFYVREIEYGSLSDDPHLNQRIWGPEILDPPLGLHPRFLLDGAAFIACRDTLDKFLESSGENLILDPLKRALMQRDLWAVFDALQAAPKSKFFAPESTAPKLSAEQEARRATMACQLARAIRALALSHDEIDRLPNTYVMAVQSGTFPNQPVDQEKANDLPTDLEDARSSWLEIFPPERGPRSAEGFVHTEVVRGRSVFRVFVKPPGDAQGANRLQVWLASVGKALDARLKATSGFYSAGADYDKWEQAMREVPPGAQFLLLRRMICLDHELKPVPTHLVESVQVRVYRPSGPSSPAQVFEEFEMDRLLLFAGRQGGLRPVRPREPRPFGYEALGRLSTEPDGRIRGHLTGFPNGCLACHASLDLVAGPPMTQSLSVISQAGRPDAQKVAHRTIQWKIEQEDYKHLRNIVANRER